MNKYVWKTSLVWLLVLVAIVAIVLNAKRRPARSAQANAAANELQPEAAGPPPTGAPQSPQGPPSLSTTEGPAPALAPINLTPERMQSIGVQTGQAEYKQLSDDVRATGNVDIDERLVSYVQVRFPGYIRKVFANATYQYVRAGEPLFTVYSPDLVATQQEFLLARQNRRVLGSSPVDGVASGAEALEAAAEQRLEQWEVPQRELSQLRETGRPIKDLTIDSPVSGYITERNALPNMYVEPSTRLYTIADLSRVWVNAQVFQDQVGRLKPGDGAQISVDAYPGRTFGGRVEQILPQVDMTTRTVRVRLAMANPGLKLKPGMFVNVDLKAPMGRALTVPASAVLQSGSRSLVFLYQGGGRILPKEVSVGARSGDDLVVLSGLAEHDKIVTSANFLIDSESQLQAAAGAFTPQSSAAAGESAPSGPQPKVNLTTTPNPPQRGSNTFQVKVTDPSGAAISGADVAVKFYMPAMPAMGMSSMDMTAKLTDRGNGLYEGTGSLGSGGTWQVTVTVQKNGKTIAVSQTRVNATGGM